MAFANRPSNSVPDTANDHRSTWDAGASIGPGGVGHLRPFALADRSAVIPLRLDLDGCNCAVRC